MKVRTMQIVDFWVGVPLCFIFSILNKIKSVLPFKKSKFNKKILFLELSEMGSAILAYSAIMKAKEIKKDYDFYFLIFKSNKESVEILNIFDKDKILTIDNSSFLKLTLSTLKTILKLRSLSLEAILDMELFSRYSTLISYLSNPKEIIGFSNYTEEGLYRGNFLTKKVFYNPTKHISINFLALSESLSKETLSKPFVKKDLSLYILPIPKFNFKNEIFDNIYLKLKKFNISKNDKLILINPDAGALPLRGWPIKYYKELISKLENEYPDYKILITGAPSSYTLSKLLCKDVNNTYNFCGETKNITEFLHLMEISTLLITQDSGPVHFASLTNIKLIALFGPETTLRYGPINSNNKDTIVISKNLHCAPCYSAANHRHSTCKDNLCMKCIGVSEVFNSVIRFLDNKEYNVINNK